MDVGVITFVPGCRPFEIVPLLSSHTRSWFCSILGAQSNVNDLAGDFCLAVSLHMCSGLQCTRRQGGSGERGTWLSSFWSAVSGLRLHLCGASLWTMQVMAGTLPEPHTSSPTHRSPHQHGESDCLGLQTRKPRPTGGRITCSRSNSSSDI